MSEIRFERRLGSSPKERGSVNEATCPDIFALSDGRFAVIGTDMTDQLQASLPSDAGVAPHERIVVITRDTLIHAKPHIPDH